MYVGDLVGALHRLDAVTGTRIWRFVSGAPMKRPPVAIGGTVYASSDKVYALSAADGGRRWSYPYAGTMLAAPNRLFVASYTSPSAVALPRWCGTDVRGDGAPCGGGRGLGGPGLRVYGCGFASRGRRKRRS
ncbi:outer membrane protein assembly factor BamB family protein [Embleya sp. MST-111070]|uniref:outer membrane protein assembly factor BamB family protein n=1 Tax=Embleya sp. MST-111070 TaxID=3398231 RepID=UPI003F73E2B2